MSDEDKIPTTWTPNLAMLHYNSLIFWSIVWLSYKQMWTHSSWSVLWCKWILVHQHQHVKSSPEGMDVSMKMCAIVLEFTNRIMHRWYHFHRFWYHFHRSWYHFHRSWSWDVWKIRRLLVSADFKGASEFVSYLKFCQYLVHYAQRRDLEVP